MLILFASAIVNVYATNWSFVDREVQTPPSIVLRYFYDSDSVVRDGAETRVWIRTVRESDGVVTHTYLSRVYCGERRFIEFMEHARKEDIRPGSVWEKLFDKVCSTSWWRKLF